MNGPSFPLKAQNLNWRQIQDDYVREKTCLCSPISGILLDDWVDLGVIFRIEIINQNVGPRKQNIVCVILIYIALLVMGRCIYYVKFDFKCHFLKSG